MRVTGNRVSLLAGLFALGVAVAGCPLPDAKFRERDAGAGGLGGGASASSSSSSGMGGAGGMVASSSSSSGMGGAGGTGGGVGGAGGAGGGCGMPASCGMPGCPPCPTLAMLALGSTGGLTGSFQPGKTWQTADIAEMSTDLPALAIAPGKVGVALSRASLASGELRFAPWSDASGFGAFAAVGSQITTRAAPAVAASASALHAVFHGDDFKHYYAEYDPQAGAWKPLYMSKPAEPVGGAAQSFGPSPAALTTLGSDVVVAYAGGDNNLYDQVRKGGLWQVATSHLPNNFKVSATPAIAAPASGPELLVVFSRDSDKALHWITRSGGTWSAPQMIPATNSTEPVLVALAGGGALLVYRDAAAGELRWSRFDGITWTIPGPVGMPAVIAKSRPALAQGAGDADAELLFVDGAGTAQHARLKGNAFDTPAAIGGTGLTGVAAATSL